jgi:hypothetical protein
MRFQGTNLDANLALVERLRTVADASAIQSNTSHTGQRGHMLR